MKANDVVEIVKNERNRRAWSQYRLANESGVSREMIAKFELGKHSPTLETLVKMCTALGLEFVIRKGRGS